jgi:type II secretory ATPase GspE/PulE/Tfp pilus assembly ATPase PilB-like protein
MGAVGKVALGRITLVRRAAPPRRELDDVGFDSHERGVIDRMLAQPHGLVLVVGGPKSGKSTTAAALTSAIVQSGRLPVAIDGLANANDARRAVARAEEALVVATIDARTGSEALARLHELGIDADELTHVLRGAIVQRLGLRLCAFCTDRYDPPGYEVALLRATAIPHGSCFARGLGCGRCDGSGRAGNVAVFELLSRPVDAAPERAKLERSVLDRLLAAIISTEEAAALLIGLR